MPLLSCPYDECLVGVPPVTDGPAGTCIGSWSPFDIGAGGLVALLEECAAALDDVVGLFGSCVPTWSTCQPTRRLTGGPPEIPRGYDA